MNGRYNHIDSNKENGREDEEVEESKNLLFHAKRKKTWKDFWLTRYYHSLILIMIHLKSLLLFLVLDRRNVALAGSWLVIVQLLFNHNKNDIHTLAVSSTPPSPPPTTVVGFIHMAKTVGTEINGELANHFERICGNKGYSYDAYQHNIRAKGKMDDVNDSFSEIEELRKQRGIMPDAKRRDTMNRGSVYPWMMDEIGYEDCDWIAFEDYWTGWNKRFKNVTDMELHLPCRSPLDHLMSQCNFRRLTFNCQASDLLGEIKKCYVFAQERFSMELATIFPTKCFNPLPMENYIEYMSTRLVRKRRESQYIHRDSNRPRNKANECIWTMNDEFQQNVKKLMMESADYYKFCEQCMGSKDELKLV